MKITISPDGTVQMEVANGDGQAALDMIRSLQHKDDIVPEQTTLADVMTNVHLVEGKDRRHAKAASLSPSQRETYDVLAAYPEGIHYTIVAEYLGVGKSVANTRCQAIANLGLAAYRIRAGVYKLREA